jgi:hypothetical protein
MMQPNDTAASRLELEPKAELTEAENKELLEEAIQKREKLAESRLEMAKMFLQNGKPEIAIRRLREIVAEFDLSAAADMARAMLPKPNRSKPNRGKPVTGKRKLQASDR